MINLGKSRTSHDHQLKVSIHHHSNQIESNPALQISPRRPIQYMSESILMAAVGGNSILDVKSPAWSPYMHGRAVILSK